LELREEGKIDSRQLKALVGGIATVVSGAKVVVPKKKLALCRDPEDDPLLECCKAAHTDIIIVNSLSFGFLRASRPEKLTQDE
jgi:predicted nucleic acid-binding protein